MAFTVGNDATARWTRMVETLEPLGFTYRAEIERIKKRGRRPWVQVTLAGRTLLVPAVERAGGRTKAGEVRKLFLTSSFSPSSPHPELRDQSNGLFLSAGSNEFSAKGHVVRTIEDWAALDCGLFIMIELEPVLFKKEGVGPSARNHKVGEAIIETGFLFAHLL